MRKLFLLLICIPVSAISFAQLQVGQKAPEISLPNAKDTIIKLSSLQGKVVLIDFWASWCGPCRASIPGLKKIYKKFKDLGFEIYSVSIDDEKKDWLKALRHDKANWTQVMDTGGWYAKTAQAYYIDEIPTSFLLDKQGTIIAINSDGKKLEERLTMLLK